jgi:hypothetical protein
MILHGMEYKSGYRYQLQEAYSVQTCVYQHCDITIEYVQLTATGLLTIKEGYAWDGATWCPDFNTVLRGSLVHDALCQLIDLHLLDEKHQQRANEELYKICLQDGMYPWLARLIYTCVSIYFRCKVRYS